MTWSLSTPPPPTMHPNQTMLQQFTARHHAPSCKLDLWFDLCAQSTSAQLISFCSKTKTIALIFFIAEHNLVVTLLRFASFFCLFHPPQMLLDANHGHIPLSRDCRQIDFGIDGIAHKIVEKSGVFDGGLLRIKPHELEDASCRGGENSGGKSAKNCDGKLEEELPSVNKVGFEEGHEGGVGEKMDAKADKVLLAVCFRHLRKVLQVCSVRSVLHVSVWQRRGRVPPRIWSRELQRET